LLTEVITDLEYETLIKEKELDIGFGIEECRLRGNICFEMNRMAGVFRLIPPKIMTLDDLKTPKVFKALMNKHKGLILFTGPTGSGKSTSLAAMIDYANKRNNYHILTIEDPVEFIHRPVKARITHRELGRDTLSFSEGLKRALRQDPDIILVGEMRDLETIQLAILASETGHLVLSTLHTSSAAKSIHRIIDVFPPHQQSQIRMTLSENLLAVISQTLIQRKDKKGREAAFEILINTNAVSNLIREEKVFQIPTIIETQSHIGMISMDQSLYDLVKNGSIDYKDALGKSNDPKLFKAKLKKGGIFDEIVSGSAES
jgi:twitching motility protein PilT